MAEAVLYPKGHGSAAGSSPYEKAKYILMTNPTIFFVVPPGGTSRTR